MRALATLVAIVASLPPIALAVIIVVNTVPQFSNPCFEWASPSAISHTTGPDDPCAAAGRGGTSETKLQALMRLLIIPGGVMVASVLAIWGVLGHRSGLVVLGAVLMFFESLPWLLTMASVAGLTTGAFLLVARACAPLERLPKVVARVLGILAAAFALGWVWTAVRPEVN